MRRNTRARRDAGHLRVTPSAVTLSLGERERRGPSPRGEEELRLPGPSPRAPCHPASWTSLCLFAFWNGLTCPFVHDWSLPLDESSRAVGASPFSETAFVPVSAGAPGVPSVSGRTVPSERCVSEWAGPRPRGDPGDPAWSSSWTLTCAAAVIFTRLSN